MTNTTSIAHASKWRYADQQFWQRQCDAADEVITYADHYTRTCMQDRNIGMVDAAARESHSLLLAIWDGSTGGTKNCVDYASSSRSPIEQIRVFAPDLFRV